MGLGNLFRWFFTHRGSAAAERGSRSKKHTLKREERERVDEYDHLKIDKRLLKTEHKEEQQIFKLVKRLKKELLEAGRLSSEHGDQLGKAQTSREAALIATLVRIDAGNKNLLKLMGGLEEELREEEVAEQHDEAIIEKEEQGDKTLIKDDQREAQEAGSIAPIERAEMTEEEQELKEDKKVSQIEQWKIKIQGEEEKVFARYLHNIQAFDNKIRGLMEADARRFPRNVLYEYDHLLGTLLADLTKARASVKKELKETRRETKETVKEYKEERGEGRAEKGAEKVLEIEERKEAA